MGCFYHYSSFQEARPALIEVDIQRGTEKREMDEVRKQEIEERVYTLVELWGCENSKLYKTDNSVTELLREPFPIKRPLRQDQLFDTVKSGAFLNHVQCDIELPEHPGELLATLPAIF